MPQELADEIIRCQDLTPEWIEIRSRPDSTYFECRFNVASPLKQLTSSGSDAAGLYSANKWLEHGPKIYCPTNELCAMFENIDVNIELKDYSQPFETIFIATDTIKPFIGVICTYEAEREIAIFNLISSNHKHDIVSVLRHREGLAIEESIAKFYHDCTAEEKKDAHRLLRVTINACLMLSGTETHTEFMLAKEMERDIGLSNQKGEKGERAKQRLKRAKKTGLQEIKPITEIRVKKAKPKTEESNTTGVKMRPHWRRGHWVMQPYGPGRTLRKRILRAPVLIHADAVTDKRFSTTIYK